MPASLSRIFFFFSFLCLLCLGILDFQLKTSIALMPCRLGPHLSFTLCGHPVSTSLPCWSLKVHLTCPGLHETCLDMHSKWPLSPLDHIYLYVCLMAAVELNGNFPFSLSRLWRSGRYQCHLYESGCRRKQMTALIRIVWWRYIWRETNYIGLERVSGNCKRYWRNMGLKS